MALNGNGNGTNGKHKDPVLVVIQLSGGNDFMNTVIPYTEGYLLRCPTPWLECRKIR